jgi:hypothetical protein
MTTIKSYFYPSQLTADSKLTDGDTEKSIEIKTPTWLAWFDLNPHLRFNHSTAYMLISEPGIEVVEGQMWPVLDGARILYHDSVVEQTLAEVYFYQDDLLPGDRLTDGDDGPEFEINNRTRLIWADLHPTAKFKHPTAYVFISAAGIHIEGGMERPVLNGNMILYGTGPFITMGRPLTVHIPAPGQ